MTKHMRLVDDNVIEIDGRYYGREAIVCAVTCQEDLLNALKRLLIADTPEYIAAARELAYQSIAKAEGK